MPFPAPSTRFAAAVGLRPEITERSDRAVLVQIHQLGRIGWGHRPTHHRLPRGRFVSVEWYSKQIALQVPLLENVYRRVGPGRNSSMLDDTGAGQLDLTGICIKPGSGQIRQRFARRNGDGNRFPRKWAGTRSRSCPCTRIFHRVTRLPGNRSQRRVFSGRRREEVSREFRHRARSWLVASENAITQLPSGETALFSRIGTVVTGSRPLPSFLMRTGNVVAPSSDRNTSSPSAPKDT